LYTTTCWRCFNIFSNGSSYLSKSSRPVKGHFFISKILETCSGKLFELVLVVKLIEAQELLTARQLQYNHRPRQIKFSLLLAILKNLFKKIVYYEADLAKNIFFSRLQSLKQAAVFPRMTVSVFTRITRILCSIFSPVTSQKLVKMTITTDPTIEYRSVWLLKLVRNLS